MSPGSFKKYYLQTIHTKIMNKQDMTFIIQNCWYAIKHNQLLGFLIVTMFYDIVASI